MVSMEGRLFFPPTTDQDIFYFPKWTRETRAEIFSISKHEQGFKKKTPRIANAPPTHHPYNKEHFLWGACPQWG